MVVDGESCLLISNHDHAWSSMPTIYKLVSDACVNTGDVKPGVASSELYVEYRSLIIDHVWYICCSVFSFQMHNNKQAPNEEQQSHQKPGQQLKVLPHSSWLWMYHAGRTQDTSDALKHLEAWHFGGRALPAAAAMVCHPGVGCFKRIFQPNLRMIA